MGTAGGEKRWVRTDKIPYRDPGGAITGLLVVTVDITESKRAEEALAGERANLQAVFDVVNVGMLVIDESGAVKQVNDTLTRWVKKDVLALPAGQPGDFVGCVHALANPAGCGHGPRCPACPIRNAFASVLQNGQPVHDVEAETTLAIDGSEVRLWLEVSADPLLLDGKRHVILAMNNITDRKRAENAAARLASIVESSDDAILSKDHEGVIQTWNAGAERLFGYRAAEVIGQSITLLLPPEKIQEEEQILERVLSGHRVEHLETVRVTKDGRQLDVSVTVSPVKDHDGRIVGASKIIRDITQRKQAEEALRQTAEDLARSNKDLEQFAYVASHDLREPLRMVTGFMSLLTDRCHGKLDAKADEYIGFASEAAGRMQCLIDDLLVYSRAGRAEMTERTDVGVVLDRVLKTLSMSIEESAAAITHDPMPTIESNPMELTQVFQNLIGNALKFKGERKPEIHVAARRQAGGWLFTVRDNGIGIDPQFADRIFMIFQRLHTREQYPGTGIGLAICKKIVERHGGRIWAESQPETGSTFCFTIPDQGKES
jgi:hypothetical protein